MSTLQISLAVVGVILLGLIVAYNTWTHRRNAPKRADAETRLSDNHSRFDPALDGVDVTNLPEHARTPFVDPLLDATPAQEGVAEGIGLDPALEASPADTATAGEGAAAEPAGRAAQQHAERKLALDGLIDAIATVRIEGVVTGDAALMVQPTTRRAGSKQFRIEGLNAASGEWETVRSGQRYTCFQAGVQLANRLGALNEIEFSEFVAKVQGFGDALNAAVDLPDMLHEVSRARELDQFAGEHDAQLSFMLRPRRAAWSPGYIEQHAAAAGFVSAAMPGRMQLPSETVGHAPLLTLAYDAQAAQADNLDQTAVHEVWLSLDVPQVPRSEDPFKRLRDVVQVLCDGMDGMLCDQNGYQLLPQVLDPIGADLQKLYDKLDSRELSAGSMLARRLFN
ncbi:cell division protein FtsZ [Comamonas jiangduensis]|uniref:cell division protein FtsZ n=1 Tax=Comamonas jiangduensis TaxID=1194168 RepID=UPI0028B03D0E|nr:cell division protein FtsZ [Comamonas jiangduensis]